MLLHGKQFLYQIGRSDWLICGRDFTVQTITMETMQFFLWTSARRTDKSTSEIPSLVFSEVSKDIWAKKVLLSTFCRTKTLKCRLFMKTAKVTSRKLPQYRRRARERRCSLWHRRIWTSNPVLLQRTVWWLLSLHFGFLARGESRKRRWGDVQLQQDKDGEEILGWLNERDTKSRHGQEKRLSRGILPLLSSLRFMPERPKDV